MNLDHNIRPCSLRRLLELTTTGSPVATTGSSTKRASLLLLPSPRRRLHELVPERVSPSSVSLLPSSACSRAPQRVCEVRPDLAMFASPPSRSFLRAATSQHQRPGAHVLLEFLSDLPASPPHPAPADIGLSPRLLFSPGSSASSSSSSQRCMG
jgi:hypothetical protein